MMGSPGNNDIRLKCHLGKDIRLVYVPQDVTRDSLLLLLSQLYGKPVEIYQYEDNVQDRITVGSDFDLKEAFAIYYHMKSNSPIIPALKIFLKITSQSALDPENISSSNTRTISSKQESPVNSNGSEVSVRAPPLRTPLALSGQLLSDEENSEAPQAEIVNNAKSDSDADESSDDTDYYNLSSRPDSVHLETPPLRTPPPSPPSKRASRDFTQLKSSTSSDHSFVSLNSTIIPTRTPPFSSVMPNNHHFDQVSRSRNNSSTPPLRTPPPSPPSSRRSISSISSTTSFSDNEEDDVEISNINGFSQSMSPLNRTPKHISKDELKKKNEDTHTPNGKVNLENRVNRNSSPAPDSVFSWKKGHILGRGGFGQVYQGLNADTGELFAVKQLDIDSSTTNDKAQRNMISYQQEVELMKQLHHENIVRYLGTQLEKNAMYIFLEYIPGGSISSLLSRYGPFSENVIRLYTKQILNGLHYLHENGIIHRDIKGANILVDTKGSVKLADFGCAKLFAGLQGQSNFKSVLGTPYWMAPEVIRAEGYGRSADIWSLGCTIIEMACGRPPWCQEFSEIHAAMFKIASSNETPQIPEHLSPEAHDFLLRCFRRDPRERPDAQALLQHAFIRNEHSSEMPPANSPSGEEITSLLRGERLTSLESLSADLLLHIFSFLPAQHFPRLAGVCKSWKNLMEDDMIWRYKTNAFWRKAKKEEEKTWKQVYHSQKEHDRTWFNEEITSKSLKGKNHSKSVLCVAYDEGSNCIVSGSEDKKIKLWNNEKGKFLKTLKGHEGSVNSVCFLDSSSKLASGSSDKKIKLWDLKSKKCILTLADAHSSGIQSVQCMGHRLASGSVDKTIKIWDLQTGKSSALLQGHNREVNAIHFVDHTIVSASSDMTVKVFDIRMEKCIRTLEGHSAEVFCCQYDKESNIIVSGSRDKTIREWDLSGGAVPYQVWRGHEEGVTCLQFDNNKIISGSEDKTLRIWNRNLSENVRVLTGHNDSITSLLFDRNKIITASKDKTIKCWGGTKM